MININSKDELSLYNLKGKWNDYIAVQKEVISVLKDEDFFEQGNIFTFLYSSCRYTKES